MKHVVELKYTNPSHEHVSLRRRVETVNRVVEAQSADEALNRAANQQRSLGFRIQSANIVEQKVEEPATQILSEETELEEGKIAKAFAVGAMALASMGAKAHTDTTKSVDQLAKERPALAQKLHDIGATGQVPASDKRAAELQKKQDQEMPASERRAKELKKEEIDIDEAKKPLKPSYWKAEWRLGTQSEVDKNNKKIYDKLAKTDPVKAAAFHDNLMKIRKEEVEQIDELKKSTLASYVKKKHDQFYQSRMKVKTQGDLDRLRKDANKNLARAEKRLDPKGPFANSKFIKSEEVESVEEGVATAQKVMDRAKVVANTNPDPKKRFAASGLAQKAMLRTINPTGVNTGITRGGGNKTYRMVTGKVPPYQLTKKTGVSEEVVTEASKEGKDVMRNMRAGLKSMDLRHGVDSDKRDAGYKMSPAVKAAQAKSDALSKVVKRPQAGTLAAAKMKEAVDPGSMKVVNKKVKAADKMIKAAKGKVNKIDLKPTLDLDSYKD